MTGGGFATLSGLITTSAVLPLLLPGGKRNRIACKLFQVAAARQHQGQGNSSCLGYFAGYPTPHLLSEGEL